MVVTFRARKSFGPSKKKAKSASKNSAKSKSRTKPLWHCSKNSKSCRPAAAYRTVSA